MNAMRRKIIRDLGFAMGGKVKFRRLAGDGKTRRSSERKKKFGEYTCLP